MNDREGQGERIEGEEKRDMKTQEKLRREVKREERIKMEWEKGRKGRNN
jgi:hypothetical protein